MDEKDFTNDFDIISKTNFINTMTEKEFKSLGGVEMMYEDDPKDYYLQIEVGDAVFIFDPKLDEFYMYTLADVNIRDNEHFKLLLKAFKTK